MFAVKAFKSKGVNLNRRVSVSSLFPLAKLHGPVNPELMNIWESQRNANKQQKDNASPPLYEKVLSPGMSVYLLSSYDSL